MENILTTITKKKKLKRIFLMSISLLLSAVLYNVFLLPLNLVTGGTNGIATITKYVYDINPALMILLLSIACAIFSFMYLGVKRTMGTLVASLVYPLLVQLTSPLNNIMNGEPVDVLLMVLFAGVLSGYGNCVIISHGDGIVTLYGHGQDIIIQMGSQVKQGDVIMTVGSTGNSTGAHLHLEIRINGEHVNPQNYLYK